MKDIRLLHPTHLLFNAIGQPPVNGIKALEAPSLCPLCCLSTTNAIPWKVTKKFSNLDLFAEKEQITFLCPACMFALKHIKELHKGYVLTYKKGFTLLQFDDQPEKKNSIGKTRVVSRYYLKEFLLNPLIDDPWILMTQSKINSQHSIIKAKVNYGYSDTLWVCNGGDNVAIPREGLEELFHSLEKVKLSDSLYPYLFSEKRPRKEHNEYGLWQEVEPIITKHKYTHYLPFIYDRLIPPKQYMLEHTNN